MCLAYIFFSSLKFVAEISLFLTSYLVVAVVGYYINCWLAFSLATEDQHVCFTNTAGFLIVNVQRVG